MRRTRQSTADLMSPGSSDRRTRIQPLVLRVPPDSAFRLARTAANRMGWDIVAADAPAGRIEATATTRWFGFKDDVVVRIEPTAEGSRI